MKNYDFENINELAEIEDKNGEDAAVLIRFDADDEFGSSSLSIESLMNMRGFCADDQEMILDIANDDWALAMSLMHDLEKDC